MPLIAATVGSAASSIVGGIMANNANKSAQAAAAAAMARAQALIDQVGAPPDLSGKIILDQLQQAGVLTPEMESQIGNVVSKVSQVKTDPATRAMQVKALQEMSKRGSAGYTPEDRAQYNQSRQGVQRDLEAKQQQIAQEMQMRGQAGGGNELAQRLLASQAGADRASEEADRISAAASQSKLQALSQMGSMSGALRGQDFNEENTKAASQDEMDRFTTDRQLAISQRNVASANQAQAANLANKQDISNANVGINNTEAQRQNEAKRQKWLDDLYYAQARANPMQRSAAQTLESGKTNAQGITNMAGGIGSAFGSLGSYFAKNQSPSDDNVGINQPNANDVASEKDKYGSMW